MKILKTLLLLSAGITVVLRLFAYNNSDFLGPDTVKLLNIISMVSAAICLICALIWVCILKAEEKKVQENEKEN